MESECVKMEAAPEPITWEEAIEESAGTDLEVVEGAALLMCYAAQGGDGYCTMRALLNNAGYRRCAR